MSPLKTLISAIALVIAGAVPSYAVPPLMNYQGILLDASSNPVTVMTSVQFTIFNDPVSGDALWSETQNVTPDASGRFNVLLGSVTPIPDAVFDGDAYLNLIVGGDPPLTPRTRIVSVGYSHRVGSIDGASGGNITSKVSIGPGHINTGNHAFVAGQNGTASGDLSVVGGGFGNEATGFISTVSGGQNNVASGYESTIGGGNNNEASGSRSAVAGGQFNEATGDFSFAAGKDNRAWGDYAIAIGKENVAVRNQAIAMGNKCQSFGISGLAVGDSNQVFLEANYSVALGRGSFAAMPGQFVFADSTNARFEAPDANTFVVRASGGVGLGTASPSGRALVVDNAFTGADDVLLDLNASVDVTASGRDILQIEVGGSATDIQYIECERGSDVEFRVNGDGNVTADGSFTGGGADFAEIVRISSGYESVFAGDVLVIDPDSPHSMVKSSQPHSTLVAGVYSSQPGFMASERDWDDVAVRQTGILAASGVDQAELPGTHILELAAALHEVPLAVVGIVPCKVSAENGPIRTGDLLVTSATPGHAMRDDNPRPGTIVGKALAALATGTGLIKVLVTLQ